MILKGKYHNIWGSPTVHESVEVGAYTEIGDDVVIGTGTVIGAYCFIPPGVRIGDYCFIGPRVTFTNDKYPVAHNIAYNKLYTVIENKVSIGAAAVILPGIRIKEGAMVGAGAIVTRDVEAGETVIGQPARLIHKFR